MFHWQLTISSWPLKDLLPALLSGLCHRWFFRAPAVQAVNPPLRHSSQSQCGTTVRILRVGCPARSHIFYYAWARVRDRWNEPGVWHQRRGRQGDHLHLAGSGQTRTHAAESAGYHHLTAGPHYLPEHLHHLYFHLYIPLLSFCAAMHLTVSRSGLPQYLCLGHTRSCNDIVIHKVNIVSQWIL